MARAHMWRLEVSLKVSSFFQSCGFQGLNLGCQAGQASLLTQSISLAP